MAEPEAPTQSRGTHVYPRECQPWRVGKDHGRRTAHAHARDQSKERVTEAGVFFFFFFFFFFFLSAFFGRRERAAGPVPQV